MTRHGRRRTCARSCSTWRATRTAAGSCRCVTARRWRSASVTSDEDELVAARGPAPGASTRCATCPVRQRTCLVLRYYDELGPDEIADDARDLAQLGQDAPAARPRRARGAARRGGARSERRSRRGCATRSSRARRRRSRRARTCSPASSSSIADDRRLRRQHAALVGVLACVVGAVVAVLAAVIDRREGEVLMDWWILEVLTTALLVAIAFWLGPLIKRFGRSYAADVFRANPRTGKSFVMLTDVAYYLIFFAYILFTVTYAPRDAWADTVGRGAAAVRDGPRRRDPAHHRGPARRQPPGPAGDGPAADAQPAPRRVDAAGRPPGLTRARAARCRRRRPAGERGRRRRPAGDGPAAPRPRRTRHRGRPSTSSSTATCCGCASPTARQARPAPSCSARRRAGTGIPSRSTTTAWPCSSTSSSGASCEPASSCVVRVEVGDRTAVGFTVFGGPAPPAPSVTLDPTRTGDAWRRRDRDGRRPGAGRAGARLVLRRQRLRAAAMSGGRTTPGTSPWP